MSVVSLARECQQCGAQLVRRAAERPSVFAKRRACDRTCAAAYRNQHRRRPAVADRFWSKVNKDGPVPATCPELGPCWIWTAGTGNGYGNFNRGPEHGLWIPAHRYSYESVIGPVPLDAVHLHHRCETPSCVNPAHLKPVTYAEHGREHRTGVCKNGHAHEKHGCYVRGELKYCRACRREQRRAV